ncbi:Uncharacterized protein At1g65710 [Linum perenne]
MGTCFSKKDVSSSPAPVKQESTPPETAATKEPDSSSKRKEVFVIKHSNSHRESQQTEVTQSENGVTVSTKVRTSSRTKEEVDAILIQCGRLSRSNSSGTPGKKSAARRRSGSKRSFDFDYPEEEDEDGDLAGDEAEDGRRQHHRRHSQSSRNSSPAGSRRRRTPSREREQRSGSRERDSGRRVSISPARRSANPTAASCSNVNPNRPPGKMVSVPPTVSSSKANCNNAVEAAPVGGVRRISVQRNVGAASPRSQSPSRANNEGNQLLQKKQPSPRKSSSRKVEHSPYRRNPLAEINPNLKIYQKCDGNDKQISGKESIQKPSPLEQTASIAATEEQQPRPRSRSARRSRDMDVNPEALLNPQPSTYTSLLLQDINNFHHKSNNSINANNKNNIPSSFELPDCVKKARSIMEAVADLNSTPTSNLSSSSSTKQHRKVPTARQATKGVESEALTIDDSMEPSFHSYVTTRRGSGGLSCGGEEDITGMQESSGSNSCVASANSIWSSREENNGSSSKSNVAPLGLGIGERVHGLIGEQKNGIGRGRVVVGGGNRSCQQFLATTDASSST